MTWYGTMKLKRLVKVEWEDACSFISEGIDKVLKESTKVDTYGILEYKDKRFHIVIMHDGKEDSCCDRLRIPTSLVRKITYLKEVK